MLIAGTGGLARDILGTMSVDHSDEGVVLFNNMPNSKDTVQYNKFPILRSFDDVAGHFSKNDTSFCVAIANPLLRLRLTEKLISLGGKPANQIAKNVYLSSYTQVEPSGIIQPGAIISSDTQLAQGTFVNCGTIIGHDVVVEKYVSFGPGVRVLGKAKIGAFSYIGTNAIVEPGVTIGERCVVGIGKIVSKDIPAKTKLI